MDIELAKTFLEIMHLGSFNEAAQRLHVTQTTITARIKALESELGKSLFVRNRAGAKLTADGERFSSYALNLVQTWEQAKQSLNLADNQQDAIRIGVEQSLWNPIMVDWIKAISAADSAIHIYNQVSEADTLIAALENHYLDAIVVHTPNYYSGFVVEQLVEEKLIHVQNKNQPEPTLFIDWGSDFKRQFDKALPHSRQAAMSFNFGPLALKIMLNQGGNGYFRTRVVSPYLAQGKLKKVQGAPEFTYPVYVMYRKSEPANAISVALERLRLSIHQEAYWRV